MLWEAAGVYAIMSTDYCRVDYISSCLRVEMDVLPDCFYEVAENTSI